MSKADSHFLIDQMCVSLLRIVMSMETQEIRRLIAVYDSRTTGLLEPVTQAMANEIGTSISTLSK